MIAYDVKNKKVVILEGIRQGGELEERVATLENSQSI